MIREAKRPLTGKVGRRDPEIRLGYNPAGEPRVTVVPYAANGTRTYSDPAELRRFASELSEAAVWLGYERTKDPGGNGNAVGA